MPVSLPPWRGRVAGTAGQSIPTVGPPARAARLFPPPGPSRGNPGRGLARSGGWRMSVLTSGGRPRADVALVLPERLAATTVAALRESGRVAVDSTPGTDVVL